MVAMSGSLPQRPLPNPEPHVQYAAVNAARRAPPRRYGTPVLGSARPVRRFDGVVDGDGVTRVAFGPATWLLVRELTPCRIKIADVGGCVLPLAVPRFVMFSPTFDIDVAGGERGNDRFVAAGDSAGTPDAQSVWIAAGGNRLLHGQTCSRRGHLCLAHQHRASTRESRDA